MSNSTELVGNLAANQNTVSRGFWQKARKTLGRVPFSETRRGLLLRHRQHHAAADPGHPVRRAAYFVLPIDAIPDFMLGLGFTDDAAIIVAALTAAKVHISDAHRKMARAWLLKEQAARQV
jgi:uncharacterized membrane protein YkvA (DUF1232 family)